MESNNGRCHCDELEAWAAKLQRAARYQLRLLQANGNDPMMTNWLHGGIYMLQLVLDGPLDQRVVAPLVRPSPEACAWSQEAACPT